MLMKQQIATKKMSRLIEQIKQKDACAFTHGGKFHADDVFSSALLLYINPEISITRGNSVPDDFKRSNKSRAFFSAVKIIVA